MEIHIELYNTIVTIYALVATYVAINTYRKLTVMESILISFEHYKSLMILRFNDALKKIKDIDIRGSFEADDEIGWTYKFITNEIKELHENVVNYFTNKPTE
jgi:hypothetical protein